MLRRRVADTFPLLMPAFSFNGPFTAFALKDFLKYQLVFDKNVCSAVLNRSGVLPRKVNSRKCGVVEHSQSMDIYRRAAFVYNQS